MGRVTGPAGVSGVGLGRYQLQSRVVDVVLVAALVRHALLSVERVVGGEGRLVDGGEGQLKLAQGAASCGFHVERRETLTFDLQVEPRVILAYVLMRLNV